MTEEISPAGLQFGLWTRGGSRERTLAQLPEKNYLPATGADPQWTDEQLSEFAAHYSVLLFTEPHSLKARKDASSSPLCAAPRGAGLEARAPGRGRVPAPMQQAPLPIAVFALRRAGAR